MTQLESKIPNKIEWATPLEVAIELRLVDRQGAPKAALVHNKVLHDKTFPRPYKFGKQQCRFDMAAVRAWAAGQPKAGDGRSELKSDGTPAKKRGRKPLAMLGGAS